MAITTLTILLLAGSVPAASSDAINRQSGSGYTLTGTITRPDATAALASADGRYALSGGFYPDQTPRRCPGDFAVPAEILDLADIVAWIGAFESGDPTADYAAPFGTLDLADIVGFVQAFTAGCP
jgi:hypothetical protein